jgi:hypothetical protein
MARKKNATFQGSRMPDVARDALILERWLENAAGDFALTFDKVTGANGHSAADTINHVGGGRGCPLHLPLASQRVKRSVALLSGSTTDDYYVIAVPIFIPDGQQSKYILEVDISDLVDPYLEIRNTSWTLTSGPTQMQQSSDISTDSFRLSVNLSAGWQYLLVGARLYAGNQDFTFFDGWRLYPDYSRNKSNGISSTAIVAGATGTSFPSLPTLSPAVATANDIDTGMVDEGVGTGARPLDAYVLTRLNRMTGTFWEFLTGAKIPGNGAYGTNTTRQLNQANFTAEPEIDFPITTVALGATLQGPSSKNWLTTWAAPTSGPTDHVRLILTQNTATTVVVSRLRAQMPSFKTTAGQRKLKLELLVARYDAGDNLANWNVFTSESSAGSSAQFALTQIGATDFFRATVTDVPYTPGGSVFLINMRPIVSAAPIDLKVIVLGYTFAFDV